MAESPVAFLIQQLSSWISQEQQLLGGLSENAEIILEEMGRMRAFLRVADEKQEVDPQLREWVNQVRDVAYDAEDVFEKFIFRFARRQTDAGLFACIRKISASIKNLKARHQLASEMRAIQSRVRRVSEGQQRYKDIYGTWDQESDGTWYDSRGDALLLEEAEVVGIEKPKKVLLELLLSSSNHDDHTDSGLKVISVVGTGGLGKTTLVKKVYDDDAVKMNFSTHLWITVSNSFKLEELLRTMIRRLVGESRQPPPHGIEAMDADEMKEFVYKFLQHRRYIIVLDDIWQLSAWEAIRYAFPRTGTCGFIIITTRLQSIGHAATTESKGYVYNLEPLSQQDSKTLFCRKAFVGGSCPDYLEEKARVVLKRCEGLPLAIVVIGSLLATKNNNIDEWNKFCERVGGELESDHLRRITKLLSLSYFDLPYYLKSCFLYFSIFPEDHDIYMYRLIRLWIAEGFVQPKEGKTMEEVAEDYVKALLDRSLIQVAAVPNHGISMRLRVHDLLHTIIVSKSKELKFSTIASVGDTQRSARIRRLAIHDSFESLGNMEGCHHLRSLLVLGSGPITNLDLSNLLSGTSRLLRVLEIRGSLSGKIPDEVFKFYLLKNLGLRGTDVKHVPRLIGNLENLETLDLRDTQVTELPVEILRLRRLRHLIAFRYTKRRGYRPFDSTHSFRAPYRIGCFSSLQTLLDIEATEADGTTVVREIVKLTQLTNLGVMKLRREDVKDFCISLTKLTALKTLHIAAKDEDEILDLVEPLYPTPPLSSLILKGRLLMLPKWIQHLQGLTKLILNWNRISDDPLESLQHLPNLMYLELNQAYQGKSLRFKASGFQRLKKLWIVRLDGLETVEVEDGSMPSLQELYMWGCKFVEEVPSGIENLSSLQYIDFSDMSEAFLRTLENKKDGEGDRWKLGHVPRVEIYSLTGDDDWQGRRL